MKIQKNIKSWLSTLVLILGLLAFRSSFADQYVVPSGSMLPTIQIGDRIMVNKMAYDLQIPFTDITIKKISEPERGDIMVFKHPQEGIVMVKRLIGLPGDQLKVVEGFIFINNLLLPGSSEAARKIYQQESLKTFTYEERIGSQVYKVRRISFRVLKDALEITVPDGHYFFMGDNRDNSADSRIWGLVPRKKLLGKALRVLFSANLLQWKPNFNWQRSGKKLYVN